MRACVACVSQQPEKPATLRSNRYWDSFWLNDFELELHRLPGRSPWLLFLAKPKIQLAFRTPCCFVPDAQGRMDVCARLVCHFSVLLTLIPTCGMLYTSFCNVWVTWRAGTGGCIIGRVKLMVVLHACGRLHVVGFVCIGEYYIASWLSDRDTGAIMTGKYEMTVGPFVSEYAPR